MEDDVAKRSLTRRLLEACGCRVWEANNTHQATAMAADLDRPIDLLLTDVVLPSMSGSALAARLRTIRPSLQVLYVSHTESVGRDKTGLTQDDPAVIQAPLTVDTLRRRIGRLLARPASTLPGDGASPHPGSRGPEAVRGGPRAG